MYGSLNNMSTLFWDASWYRCWVCSATYETIGKLVHLVMHQHHTVLTLRKQAYPAQSPLLFKKPPSTKSSKDTVLYKSFLRWCKKKKPIKIAVELQSLSNICITFCWATHAAKCIHRTEVCQKEVWEYFCRVWRYYWSVAITRKEQVKRFGKYAPEQIATHTRRMGKRFIFLPDVNNTLQGAPGPIYVVIYTGRWAFVVFGATAVIVCCMKFAWSFIRKWFSEMREKYANSKNPQSLLY